MAVEGAKGFYLLGSKTSMSGLIPPPGTYVQNVKYSYSGDTKAAVDIAGLTILGGVKAKVFFDLPSAIWVAPGQLFGGSLALNLTTPIGYTKVQANAATTGRAATRRSNDTDFGDPVIGASLGWHSGNWHWNIGALLNVPLGFWQKKNLSNIGFNRWAVDTNAAITWFDPQRGLEFSAATGITFNDRNSDIDYKSGREFHVEWAMVQNLSKALSIGISGYHYRQITEDTGSGASLGAFKGRATGLGPVVNYSFTLRNTPISTSLRYFREFDVRNRLSGDAFMFSATMPLSPARQ